MYISGNGTIQAAQSTSMLEVTPGFVQLDGYGVNTTPITIKLARLFEDTRTYDSVLFLVTAKASVTSASLGELYRSTEAETSASITLPNTSAYQSAMFVNVAVYKSSIASANLILTQDIPVVLADAPFFRRTEPWASTIVYRRGDAINIDNIYYRYMSRVPGNTSVDPKTYIANNPSGTIWEATQIQDVLAGKIVVGDWAQLAAAIFQDNLMFSQYGTDADGNESSDYRTMTLDTDGNPTDVFTPNIWINLLKGTGYFGNGFTLGGVVDVKSTTGEDGLTISPVNVSAGYEQRNVVKLSLYHNGVDSLQIIQDAGETGAYPLLRMISSRSENLNINPYMITMNKDTKSTQIKGDAVIWMYDGSDVIKITPSTIRLERQDGSVYYNKWTDILSKII